MSVTGEHKPVIPHVLNLRVFGDVTDTDAKVKFSSLSVSLEHINPFYCRHPEFVFTPMCFCAVDSDLGSFSPEVLLIWTGVNISITLGADKKQLRQDHFEELGPKL